MTAQFTFDATEVVDLAQAWRQMPDEVSHQLSAATWENLLLLEREIKELTPTGVGGGGGLRGSIAAQQPVVSADQVRGVVGTSAAHAVPVELGTKPHFPPIEPLKDWVRAKFGLRAEADVTRAAFAVARAISIRGTQGVGMFNRSFAAQQGQMERRYRQAVEQIAEALAQ